MKRIQGHKGVIGTIVVNQEGEYTAFRPTLVKIIKGGVMIKGVGNLKIQIGEKSKNVVYPYNSHVIL